MLPSSLRLAEVVSALSRALDLGSGSTAWHSVRTCILGMRIAAELKLPEDMQNELYYALLLKDAGSSGSPPQIYGALSEREQPVRVDLEGDWARASEDLHLSLSDLSLKNCFPESTAALVRLGQQGRAEAGTVAATSCERGSALARLMGLPEATAVAIGALDERWDGQGSPQGLKGEQIPLASRIILLAQMLDLLFTTTSAEAAMPAIAQKSCRWFDPEAVRAARSVAKRGELWSNLESVDLRRLALESEPGQKTLSQGAITLEAISQAFALIVDAKSPFTFNHSIGVANTAVAMAEKLDLDVSRILLVRHAALLHDLGKMAVPNTILQKAGKLNPAEWDAIRRHPEYTWEILGSIRGFEEMGEIAAAHHERLDGSGYFRGLSAPQLSIEARILAVADVFDALSARRPYREAMPAEKVRAILRRSAPHALDATCLEALEQTDLELNQTGRDLSRKHFGKAVNRTLRSGDLQAAALIG